jgi:hypothetical protein
MRQTKLMLPDASPLFSFAGIDRLDLLLLPRLPIVLTDYIEWEATRNRGVTAQRIERWIAGNRPLVSVVETETGKERIRKDRAGIPDRRKNMGEITVFEALSNDYVGEGPFLFLFEDEKMLRQIDPTFAGIYPVHLLTTFAFLVGLERKGLVPDADAVFDEIRGRSPVISEDEKRMRRPGVKKTMYDRPHRDSDGEDTTWAPKAPGV